MNVNLDENTKVERVVLMQNTARITAAEVFTLPPYLRSGKCDWTKMPPEPKLLTGLFPKL